MMSQMDVSIIIPIFNGEKWIDKCFEAILDQTALTKLNLEICVCNDASSDDTDKLLQKWEEIFGAKEVRLKVYQNESEAPRGVGYGKNRAVSISSGRYLCFQDIDDVMFPERILKQFELAESLSDDFLIGCKYVREPKDSTLRYTNWANTLTPKQLNEQIYTSNGPTIIMPTWFCHRNLFDRIGGFSEEGKGTPEDLLFFYKHIDLSGKVARVDETLLIYQYHPEATTFSINEKTIWDIRIKQLEKNVLPNWKRFTIWNGGKQGRRFYNSLSKMNREKVIAFCDVDVNKIGKFYEHYNERTRTVDCRIPIVNYKNAEKPFIICVKQDLTDGVFEKNLLSLNLEEGSDYVFFS